MLLWINVGHMHSSCILPASNEQKRVDKVLETKNTRRCSLSSSSQASVSAFRLDTRYLCIVCPVRT